MGGVVVVVVVIRSLVSQFSPLLSTWVFPPGDFLYLAHPPCSANEGTLAFSLTTCHTSVSLTTCHTSAFVTFLNKLLLVFGGWGKGKLRIMLSY